jgi:hypothetical protein
MASAPGPRIQPHHSEQAHHVQDEDRPLRLGATEPWYERVLGLSVTALILIATALAAALAIFLWL